MRTQHPFGDIAEDNRNDHAATTWLQTLATTVDGGRCGGRRSAAWTKVGALAAAYAIAGAVNGGACRRGGRISLDLVVQETGMPGGSTARPDRPWHRPGAVGYALRRLPGLVRPPVDVYELRRVRCLC